MFEFDDPRTRMLRISARIAFRGSGGGYKHAIQGGRKSEPGGVLIKGGYRYHRGLRSTQNAGEKLEAHLKYQDGERKHQRDEGLDEKRNLFSDHGQQIAWRVAADTHKDAFIEHRLILSPGGQPSIEDLHIHAQATIQRVRENNPQAAVRSTYAIHTDTTHGHVHIIMTSENRLLINKDDYRSLREFNQEIKLELAAGKEFDSQNLLNREADQQAGQQLER